MYSCTSEWRDSQPCTAVCTSRLTTHSLNHLLSLAQSVPSLSLFSSLFPSRPPSPPFPSLCRLVTLLRPGPSIPPFPSIPLSPSARAHQDAFPEFALAKNQVAEFRITSKIRTALSTGMGMGPPGAIDTTGINLGALKEALDAFYARTSGSAKLGQMGKACVAVLNLRIGLQVSVRSANKNVHRVVDRRSSRRAF